MDPESLQRRRATRAHERRQRVVRRRIAALAALAGVAVIAVVVVASSGGSTTSSSGGAAVASGNGADAHKHLHAAHHRARAATYPERGASTASVLGPATGKPGTASVPILMYHVINAAADRERRSRACTCRAAGVRRPDAGAQISGLASGHARSAARLLEARRAPASGQADRAHLRQRLPLAVRDGAAGPQAPRLGSRREHPAQRPAAVPGRADQRRGPRSGRGGLGARHPGDQPRRPDHARPVRAPLPGRHRPRDPQTPVRRAGQLVLLPVGPLQRDRNRCRPFRRVRRLDDGRPGLGRPVE